MEVRAMSDFFQHRYYRTNKMLLKLTGQWPYQNIRTRLALSTAVILLGISQIVPQGIAILKHLDDWDFLVNCITPMTFDGVCFINFVFSIFNSKQMLRLLDRMLTDWDVLARDPNVDILHEYAEKGRKMTIAYADLSMLLAVAGYTSCVLFTTQPVLSKIIDIFLRNGTEPGEFSVPVDYLIIDEQKYYFHIVLLNSVNISMAFIIVIAHDCMFIVFVYHACGLYALLGRKMERIGKNERSVKRYEIRHASGRRDMHIKDLDSCIDRHNEAIEYAKLIEAGYSWCFLFIVGLNMFLITVTGLQIFVTTLKPQEILRFIAGNVFAMMHLYSECHMAQMLMDHSISIHDSILDSEWYRLPVKVQKYLVLMVMRCKIPCTITAGKISTMSMEMFMTVLKTSISYFTLLRSM